MFIRFVVARIDPDSGRRAGLFVAIHDLDESGALTSHEEARWTELEHWFDENLRAPGRFTRSAHAHAKKVAISWFKPTATEPVRRMHQIGALLRAHDIDVELIRTSRPGYVVYEDDLQIVAEPFRDTRA